MKKIENILKKVCLIILGFSISVQIVAQDRSWVYMKDGDFYKGCEEFYMMGVNYGIMAIEAQDGNTYVSPTINQCSYSACDPSYFSCGENPDEWKDEMIQHFHKMDSLKFNTIRITHLLEVSYDDYNPIADTSILYASMYSIQDPNIPDCYSKADTLELDEQVFERQGDLLQQVIDIIYEKGFNLKILPLMGGHGVEMLPDEYADYLEYMAERFKDEPVIIGYDLYNEPINFAGDSDLDKYQVTEICLDWYNAIKRKSPSHLVTMGTKFYDLYKWDPEIMPVDFISFHPYALKHESENYAYQPPVDRYKVRLKYMSRNFSVPYLIGESGYSATDKFRDSCDTTNVHPRVGNTVEQLNFAIESLKYTKWYGHKGYTWWKYKDTPWFECDNSKAYKGYYGIIYLEDTMDSIPEEHKPYGDIIINYSSYLGCDSCYDPDPEIYANPTFINQTNTLMYGSILDSTNNNTGIEDVFIWASIVWITDSISENSFSITDSLGRFQIKTSFLLSDIKYVELKYSKPGWLKRKKGYNSTGIPTDSVKYYLEPLNPDSIAQKPVYQSWVIPGGLDTTWYNPQVPASSNVVVKEGATLTIKTRVHFNHGNRLIVERGGTLIIDTNGILTSNCSNDLWAGVEVWGNASLSQTSDEQGIVKLINGGTIENALIGIKVIKTIVDQGEGEMVNYHYTGGKVLAYEAVFKNNKIAVKFYDYDFPSNSYFTDCDFIINDNYIGTTSPDYFIKMYSMNGVDVKICRFENNSSNNCYGSGIYSFNSGFKIEGKCLSGIDPCEEWDYGEFKDLKYAIYATSGGTVYFPRISHTGFTGNYRGVYFSALENGSVKNCTITTGPMCAGGSYGIYLDASTGYTIEDNYFTAELYGGIGVVVNNSGSDPNIIYNNKFTDLLFAIVAQKENRGPDGTGLVLKCNEYSDNDRDELVLWKEEKITDKAGIAASQGANLAQPDAPAGNLFSYKGPEGTPTDIYNEANDITYYYHDNEDYPLLPKYITTASVFPEPVDDAQWILEESCPPSDQGGGGGGSGDIEEMKGRMAISGYKADSVQSIINILKDGGSTEDLKWEVDMSTPPETYQVYNQLMNNSPYISDTVMEAAIGKEEVLPNVMIRDVMVANPHNAKDGALMEKIEERTDPMPAYMKAQILQGGSLVSVFENLQSNLAYYKQQRTLAFNALVKYYITDTINPAGSIDSLMVLLENENSLSAKYWLAFLSMEQGAWSEGQNILSNISGQFNLNDDELYVHGQFVNYYNLLVDLAGDGNTFAEADSAQIEFLFDIEALQAGLPSVYARNILLALGEINYDEPILTPDFLKSSAAHNEYVELMKTLEEHYFLKVFPNPAGDYLIIEQNLEIVPDNAYVKIRNTKGEIVKHTLVTGKQNQQALDIKELKPGVYIVTIYLNNKELESIKFTKTN